MTQLARGARTCEGPGVIRRAILSALEFGPDGALPTEFRLFAAGVNATTKGEFLFDRAACKAVLADRAARGVDCMIDLNHESLDAPLRNDSLDARGWHTLEARETATGPELWAVSVRWTPDGAERLLAKKQRYISPAFEYDTETGRIVSYVNCAICADPATYGARPLVAATAKKGDALQRALAYVRARK